jgi:DNA repair exonuclease SbcCD ATPase subunit
MGEKPCPRDPDAFCHYCSYDTSTARARVSETISKEEVDALRSQIIQLKEKNEKWQMQHFQDHGDIKILKRERDEKEKEIQACQKKIKDVKANEEKFNGLASADENFKAKYEKIRLMEHSNKNLYDAGSAAMKAQGEWKQKYEEKVQKLREVTQKYKKLEQKGMLEKQKLERSYAQERHENKKSIEKYEKSLAQLVDAHENQMNHLTGQIGRLEDDLRQHKLTIDRNFLFFF